MEKWNFKRGPRGDGCWVGVENPMNLCYEEMTRFWRLSKDVKNIAVVLNARRVEESYEVTSYTSTWSRYFMFDGKVATLCQQHRWAFETFLEDHARCFISVEVDVDA